MADLLHEKALVLVKNFKKAERELIELLSQIDKTKGFLKHGASSLFAYCVKSLELSESETARFIQVMRKSESVPELKSAIAEGLLTVSKASRIAAVIDRSNATDWIHKAMTLPQRDIEREVAQTYPKAVTRESLRVLTPERTELKLSISIECEAKLRRAQAVFRKRTLEETLDHVLDLAIHLKDPKARAARLARVESNAKKVVAVQSQPPTPVPRPSRNAEREKRASIPASIKHQVFLRDQGQCKFPGCNDTYWVEMHHMKLLRDGGAHALENLTTLCGAHHKFLHRQNHRTL